MKKIILCILLASTNSFAHEIEGTLMLKGALKTKILVNRVKTTCRLKVEKVRNLLKEDDYGNPAYQAQIELSLDGSDFERNLKVKYEKQMVVTNLHQIGSVKKVLDLEYFNATEQVTVIIDREGRLVRVKFPYQGQSITCSF